MVIKKYILACFILNICFSQNWIQSQRIEKQFKDAVSSYNSGRYATSETLLNKIIDSGLTSTSTSKLLSRHYFDEGQHVLEIFAIEQFTCDITKKYEGMII